VALEETMATHGNGVHIAVLRLPRIANFDDLDPLRLEPGVRLSFIHPGEAIPGDARLVIIPGSKSTIADLAALRREGWDIDLAAHVRRGGHVLGLCGGYQMLGRAVHDPEGLEGPPGTAPGLGLLDIETTLTPDKTLTRVSGAHVPSGAAVSGYEIHLGRTEGPDCARPFACLSEVPDGAVNRSGRIAGTYLHGCFASDSFRDAYLGSLGASAGGLQFEDEVEAALDALADHLARHLGLDRILALAEPI
jgi:adenosylcobyric acid synthase